MEINELVTEKWKSWWEGESVALDFSCQFEMGWNTWIATVSCDEHNHVPEFHIKWSGSLFGPDTNGSNHIRKKGRVYTHNIKLSQKALDPQGFHLNLQGVSSFSEAGWCILAESHCSSEIPCFSVPSLSSSSLFTVGLALIRHHSGGGCRSIIGIYHSWTRAWLVCLSQAGRVLNPFLPLFLWESLQTPSQLPMIRFQLRYQMWSTMYALPYC